jgi:Protein of unknown function (DUF998)
MTATQSRLRPGAASTSGSSRLGWLALAAPVGSIGSLILYIVLGALRPGYDPVRQQISVLGIGSHGFWMDLGFVLSGLFVIIGMIGFARALRLSPGREAAVTTLLAFPGLGLIICGFFHMDTHLLVHTIGAQIACGLPIFTFAISAGLLWRTTRPIAIWLLVAAALTLLALLGYMFLSPTTPADFKTIQGGGTVGLWERILTTVLFVICYASLGIIGAVLARRDARDQSRV